MSGNSYNFRLKYLLRGRRAIPRIIRTYARYFLRPEKISLRSMSIVMGYNCNCRCSFCSVDPLRKTEVRPLDVDQIKNVIDQGLSLGVINVEMSGGEPLLYMDKVLEIIRYIKGKNALSTVVTNGFFLEKNLELLIDAGISNIFVSMDGLGDDHDGSRGVKGLFSKSFRAILKAKEKGITVGVRGLISNQNLENKGLEKLVDFASSNNIVVGATPVYSASISGKGHSVNVLSDSSQERLRKMQREKPNLFTDLDFNIIRPACPAVRERVIVLLDGEVIPCAGIMVSFGNVREMKLEEILSKMRKTKDLVNISRRCRSGEDKEFCERWIKPIIGEKLPVRIEEHPIKRGE